MADNSTVSPPHSLNILFFQILCYWPLRTRSENINRLQRILGRLSFVAFAMFVISLYVNIVLENDMKGVTALFPVALVYSMGLAKVLFVMRHHRCIDDLVRRAGSLEANILAGKDAHLKTFVRNCRKTTYSMIWTYTVIVFCLGFVFAIQPWLERAIRMGFEKDNLTTFRYTSIFDGWVPWDKMSHVNYNLTYFYDSIMLFLGSSQQAAYDTFLLALVMHVIMQLRMLEYKLVNLTRHKRSLFDDKWTAKNGTEGKIVQIHKEFVAITSNGEEKHREENLCTTVFTVAYTDWVLCLYGRYDYPKWADQKSANNYPKRKMRQFVYKLDSLTKGIMFLYYSVASLTLCCTVYQLSLPDMSPAVLVKMAGFTLVLLMQLYTLFWHGNQLTVQSRLLLAASYDCRWYDCGLSFQKDFLLLRHCFYKQHILSIGNISKVSLQTFLAILKTTYSVFTIMRQRHTARHGNQDIVIF